MVGKDLGASEFSMVIHPKFESMPQGESFNLESAHSARIGLLLFPGRTNPRRSIGTIKTGLLAGVTQRYREQNDGDASMLQKGCCSNAVTARVDGSSICARKDTNRM
ncbi:hypothetical protein [Dyella flagellata]|uniref:hypothetical protein n=1 Tax=Dyella flagellata TaxID=1867833 RepID=UPI0024E05900|nr:hypothetical protein [Dyella flagellata]